MSEYYTDSLDNFGTGCKLTFKFNFPDPDFNVEPHLKGENVKVFLGFTLELNLNERKRPPNSAFLIKQQTYQSNFSFFFFLLRMKIGSI